MKVIRGLVAALIVLLPCVAQADLVRDGFPTDPGMAVTVANPITARLATGSTGGTWTMQSSVNINHWWHYAPLQIGVEGTGSDADFIPNGWDQVTVRFNRGDDANRRACIWFHNPTAGWGWNPWQDDPTSVSGALEEGTYNVWLMGRPGGQFRAIVSTATSVAWDSGWRFFGNFDSVSGMIIQVPNVFDVGQVTQPYISYDPAYQRINFYGYQGYEGTWYKYDIGGYIRGLGLVTGIDYNVLPQTSYNPMPAQTAELVETDYSADPPLTVEPSGDYLDFLCGTRPVPGTLGGAFLLESEIGITRFNHYGMLRQGVLGAGRWNRAYIMFQKADDGVERCFLALQREDGYEFRATPSGPMPSHAGDPLVSRASIIYDPAKGVRGVVRYAANGSVVYDSGWISSAFGETVTLDVTDEFTEVNNGQFPAYGGGSITYNAANSRVNFVSYVGTEGAYPYELDGYVDSVALRYNVGSFAALPTYTSSDWPTLIDGAIGQFTASCVTNDVADSFFVESSDRTKGIRVGKLGTETYYAGSTAYIGGTISTDANGERKITPSQIRTSVGSPLDPIGMTNKTVGGGPSGVKLGVTDGQGLNNVGLFVRVWGRPSLAESSNAFMLDDGSGVGVRVQLPPGKTHSWTSVTLPASVQVAGAVGMKKTGSYYGRTIYISDLAKDVVVVAP